MKEKTFEELIEGESNIKLVDESDWNNIQFSALDMIEFGKQVREATIAECLEQIDLVDLDTILKIEHLPTDRIQLTENK